MVPKVCPKKLAFTGLSLVPVAIRVCWYKPLELPRSLKLPSPPKQSRLLRQYS